VFAKLISDCYSDVHVDFRDFFKRKFTNFFIENVIS